MWIIEFNDGKVKVLGDQRFDIIEFAKNRENIKNIYQIRYETFLEKEFEELKKDILKKYKLNIV